MPVTMRQATSQDLPAIVAMLANDGLGANRETPDNLDPYIRAFAEIDVDPNNYLIVAEQHDTIVGTFSLTIIPGLSRTGTKRALIEAVRVHENARGSNVGTAMIDWAIDTATRLGCGLIQLTSDKSRHDAHRFYTRLGFISSHDGFKLALPRPA